MECASGSRDDEKVMTAKRPVRIRVIPSLLLRGDGLVKTVRFRDPVYVGDPINTVKLFNDKEVDEIVVLDITASRENRGPNLDKIREIASEAFMPMAYGGGITTMDEIAAIFFAGVEKVILNSVLQTDLSLVTEASRRFGAQSIVASIDAKKRFIGGYQIVTHGGSRKKGITPSEAAQRAVDAGAGEVLINSVERDGTGKGYDIGLISSVTSSVSVPVVACGGASSVDDFVHAVRDGGASAVAAGSMFVFHGVHRAVLVSFPDEQKLKQDFFEVVSSRPAVRSTPDAES